MASVIRAVLHGVGPVFAKAGVAIESVGARVGGAPPRSAYVAAKQVEDADWPIFAVTGTEGIVSTDFDKFKAPSAEVSSEATLETGASVWYNAVLEGKVSLGSSACVMAGAKVSGSGGKPTVIGNAALVAARAQIGEGSTIGEGSVVSAGAVLEAGVKVEDGAIVGPGAVVKSGSVVKSSEYWAGSPAKKVREVNAGELEGLAQDISAFAALAPAHAKNAAKDVFELYAERDLHANRHWFVDQSWEDANDPDIYMNIDPQKEYDPINHPERSGLVFDRKMVRTSK